MRGWEGKMGEACRLAAVGLCVMSLMLSVALAAAPAGALADELDVVFDFSPSQASYPQGENVTIEFTVSNAVPNDPDFPTVVEASTVKAWFGWMGTAEWQAKDVRAEARWLNSSEMQAFSMVVQIPANATPKQYSYKLVVDYQWERRNTTFGVFQGEWQSLLYYPFEVTEKVNTPGGDLWPFLIGAVVLIAVGSTGAVLYYRRGPPKIVKKNHAIAKADSMGLAEAPEMSSSEFPIIHTVPGERFPIERGFVYLVKERRPGIAFAMFNEAVHHGAQGMLVVREHPNRLKQMHEFEAAKILWLTRRVGGDHIDPTQLGLLTQQITKFVESTPKTVVLLEGLEYLITQNSFESVLKFVNHMHDFVLAHDSAIVIVLDPRVLSTRELALLERSARIVEPGEYSVNNGKPATDELEA